MSRRMPKSKRSCLSIVGLLGSIIRLFFTAIIVSAQRALREKQTLYPTHCSPYSSFPSIFSRVYSISLGIQVFWLGFCPFISWQLRYPRSFSRINLGCLGTAPRLCCLSSTIGSHIGVGADTTGCLTGTAELGVDVAGPSFPVCPRVAAMISLFQSISLSSSNFGTVRVSPLWNQVQSHLRSLLLTGSFPEYPGQAPKARFLCGVARHASSGCVSSSRRRVF